MVTAGVNTDRIAPRSISEPQQSLESRNQSIIDNSFIPSVFTEAIRKKQQECGCEYAIHDPDLLRGSDIQIEGTISFGYAPFFDLETNLMIPVRSVWVSAEGGGYFYVMTLKKDVTSDLDFTSPIHFLQAWQESDKYSILKSRRQTQKVKKVM